MKQKDKQVLKTIREDLRRTLVASVEPPPVVTDHECLEDIAFMLQRTINAIDHQIASAQSR